MSSDYANLIERMRCVGTFPGDSLATLLDPCQEAADALQALLAENERLREELEQERSALRERIRHLQEELAAAQRDAEKWRAFMCIGEQAAMQEKRNG